MPTAQNPQPELQPEPHNPMLPRSFARVHPVLLLLLLLFIGMLGVVVFQVYQLRQRVGALEIELNQLTVPAVTDRTRETIDDQGLFEQESPTDSGVALTEYRVPEFEVDGVFNPAFTISYPNDWTYEINETAEGINRTVRLTSNGTQVQILQGFVDGGSCAYPEDPRDIVGAVAYYGEYQALTTASGETWRIAQLENAGPTDDYTVCQLGPQAFSGLTAIGQITVTQTASNPTDLETAIAILESIQIAQ